jgi:Leucine-rich repeat (LRR) protein
MTNKYFKNFIDQYNDCITQTNIYKLPTTKYLPNLVQIFPNIKLSIGVDTFPWFYHHDRTFCYDQRPNRYNDFKLLRQYQYNIHGLDISHSDIIDLSYLKNLKRLTLYKCDSILDLECLTNIVELELYFCDDINNLSNLKNLKHLIIDTCPNINNLDNLDNLTELKLKINTTNG